ncbi:MAG: hypothetical protein V8S24_01255 [Gordonibacter pamelaeae]
MDRTDERYGAYVSILEEELIAAMGCTEPIAIALAAARARELLGVEPARVQVAASGSIIKNESVVVPHTGAASSTSRPRRRPHRGGAGLPAGWK